jgi:hypothetical protein
MGHTAAPDRSRGPGATPRGLSRASVTKLRACLRQQRRPSQSSSHSSTDAHGFDAFVEEQCASFYAKRGRPSLAPWLYGWLLLVGYFEVVDFEQGIAGRAADSLALRGLLGLGLTETPLSLDDLAHAPADRSRNASGRIHVDFAGVGGAALVAASPAGF